MDEIGLILKLNLDDGCIRYEISLYKEDCYNYYYFICKNCGKIMEVKEDFLDNIEKEI